MEKARTLGRMRALDQSSMGLDWCHEFYREHALLTNRFPHQKGAEMIGEFHLHDGLNFRRLEDGSVVIRITEDDMADSPTIREVRVAHNGWASVVASVSATGETEYSFQAAKDLHDGK
jgi:hypothetical protein